MNCSLKFVLNCLLLFTLVALIFFIHHERWLSKFADQQNIELEPTVNDPYNLWCIFTKANSSYRLRENLRNFVRSLLINTSIPLTLHVVTDNASMPAADDIFIRAVESSKKQFSWEFYDVASLVEPLQEMIQTMQKHFSSQPGAYYGDALFFLSLGLHRVTTHSRAVLIDIDAEIRVDIRELFLEFDKMPADALVAAAPEQTPVYRHVLHMYRAQHRHSRFGEPLTSRGNPGLNSGVLLLNLEGQRKSELYQALLTAPRVAEICDKYQFHGHLGDQDWYTLVSEEYPRLIHWLDCTWNRQLCLWWRHHGYHDIFELFHTCKGTVKIFHGNCNTRIPDDTS